MEPFLLCRVAEGRCPVVSANAKFFVPKVPNDAAAPSTFVVGYFVSPTLRVSAASQFFQAVVSGVEFTISTHFECFQATFPARAGVQCPVTARKLRPAALLAEWVRLSQSVG